MSSLVHKQETTLFWPWLDTGSPRSFFLVCWWVTVPEFSGTWLLSYSDYSTLQNTSQENREILFYVSVDQHADQDLAYRLCVCSKYLMNKRNAHHDLFPHKSLKCLCNWILKHTHTQKLKNGQRTYIVLSRKDINMLRQLFVHECTLQYCTSQKTQPNPRVYW